MILFKAILIGRVGIKKNGKSAFVKNGRTFVTTSQRYKSWEKQATLQLLQAKVRSSIDLPIRIPINLSIKFYFPNHQHESDLTNLIQGPEDLLQTLGIIENDKLVHSLDGSRKIFGADQFYTEIEISTCNLI
jgi:Holliday junction resolvase RusA-like endonuclease